MERAKGNAIGVGAINWEVADGKLTATVKSETDSTKAYTVEATPTCPARQEAADFPSPGSSLGKLCSRFGACVQCSSCTCPAGRKVHVCKHIYAAIAAAGEIFAPTVAQTSQPTAIIAPQPRRRAPATAPEHATVQRYEATKQQVLTAISDLDRASGVGLYRSQAVRIFTECARALAAAERVAREVNTSRLAPLPRLSEPCGGRQPRFGSLPAREKRGKRAQPEPNEDVRKRQRHAQSTYNTIVDRAGGGTDEGIVQGATEGDGATAEGGADGGMEGVAEGRAGSGAG